MSFYALQDALELALLLQYHDANCRHDLHKGFITSERDYVSNLATHLRYPVGSITNSRIPSSAGLPLPAFDGSVTSFTLPPSYEQKLGFDGVIILAMPGEDSNAVSFKIGLFEAKWPRMFGGHQSLYPSRSGNVDNWDKKSKAKPAPAPAAASHFSSQISLQHQLSGTDLVLWEQFFSEEKVGSSTNPQFKKFGSTCVFHQDAHAYMISEPTLNHDDHSQPNSKWKRSDLTSLLTTKTPHTLAGIIFGMASCAYGKPIVGTSNRVTVPVANVALPTTQFIEGAAQNTAQFSNDIVFSLPTEDPSSNGAVLTAMRKYGFTNLTYVTLSEAGKARAIEEQAQLKTEDRIRKINQMLEEVSEKDVWVRRVV